LILGFYDLHRQPLLHDLFLAKHQSLLFITEFIVKAAEVSNAAKSNSLLVLRSDTSFSEDTLGHDLLRQRSTNAHGRVQVACSGSAVDLATDRADSSKKGAKLLTLQSLWPDSYDAGDVAIEAAATGQQSGCSLLFLPIPDVKRGQTVMNDCTEVGATISLYNDPVTIGDEQRRVGAVKDIATAGLEGNNV
jgi:hypothetical protein